MRLFIAAPTSGELKKEIKRYQKTIAHLPLRLTPPENLHITLVFLGEIPEENIPLIEEKIQTVIKKFLIHNSLFLIPQNFQPGPDPRRPRLAWLTLKASPSLLELQKRLAHALATEEKRPFRVHITVTRFKPNFKLTISDVQKLTKNIGTSDVNKFETKELQLMESKLERSGAKYKIVKRFPLMYA
ncbi:MAG: RNA 2',3'-cyclic phosphodiesterase [Candidatus Portnoybacteria bacterium]|nr:RNA 2',3'-cyclic phosphodiesterase [Candidatus Portnoybacteria bacterium]